MATQAPCATCASRANRTKQYPHDYPCYDCVEGNRWTGRTLILRGAVAGLGEVTAPHYFLCRGEQDGKTYTLLQDLGPVPPPSWGPPARDDWEAVAEALNAANPRLGFEPR